jgi:hypothetical protein
MWFWAVNGMTELVSCMPEAQLETNLRWVLGSELVLGSCGSCASRTPGWSPLLYRCTAYTAMTIHEQAAIAHCNVKTMHHTSQPQFIKGWGCSKRSCAFSGLRDRRCYYPASRHLAVRVRNYSRLSIIRAWFNRFAAQPWQCIFKEKFLFSVSITFV